MHTMNLRNWKGWQLSNDSVPAVVARTCALPEVNVTQSVVTRSAHKTSGDLIFSASRVRLILFQAYGTDEKQCSDSSLEVAYRSDGSEYAWLAAELLIVIAVIPA